MHFHLLQEMILILYQLHLHQDNLESQVQNYDFEHIRACNDPNVTEDDPDQNTIGNLVLLEYYINRSIQDIPFEQKTETTSLIINELQKVKTLEEQAVLLVYAFDLYAKENPPEESSE